VHHTDARATPSHASWRKYYVVCRHDSFTWHVIRESFKTRTFFLFFVSSPRRKRTGQRVSPALILSNKKSFLGAVVKFRRTTISFVLSVCLHGTNRLPLDGFSCNFVFEFFFRKSVGKSQVSFSRTWITGTPHEDQYTFSIISRSVLLTIKNGAYSRPITPIQSRC